MDPDVKKFICSNFHPAGMQYHVTFYISKLIHLIFPLIEKSQEQRHANEKIDKEKPFYGECRYAKFHRRGYVTGKQRMEKQDKLYIRSLNYIYI